MPRPTDPERAVGPARHAASAPARHLSLLRSFHVADFLTLANGACGVAAVLLAVAHGRHVDRTTLVGAAMLVCLALVFDVCDGRVARWRQQHSALGRELDSLADIVSFGVAPAAIAFSAGLDTWLDALMLVFFTLCGLSRLARYNVTAEALSVGADKVAYFEGTPIPTSVVPLACLMLGYLGGRLFPVEWGVATFHLLSLPFVVSGCLMVSRTVRIPKP